MIKATFLLRRRPELTYEQFSSYWRDHHAKLASEVANSMRIRKYVQVRPVSHPIVGALAASRGSSIPDFDGIAEVWWDNFEDLGKVAEKDAQIAARILEDERQFVDLERSEIWFGTETIEIDSGPKMQPSGRADRFPPSELSDRLSIAELYAKYSIAVDAVDADAFASCFTEDGFADISSFKFAKILKEHKAPYIDASSRIRGRINLRKAVQGEMPGGLRFHHCTINMLIRSIQGDEATATAYFVVFASDDGKVEHYGRYEDTLTRGSDGRWFFAERREVALFERDR